MDKQTQIREQLGEATRAIDEILNTLRDDGGNLALGVGDIPTLLEIVSGRVKNAREISRELWGRPPEEAGEVTVTDAMIDRGFTKLDGATRVPVNRDRDQFASALRVAWGLDL